MTVHQGPVMRGWLAYTGLFFNDLVFWSLLSYFLSWSYPRSRHPQDLQLLFYTPQLCWFQPPVFSVFFFLFPDSTSDSARISHSYDPTTFYWPSPNSTIISALITQLNSCSNCSVILFLRTPLTPLFFSHFIILIWWNHRPDYVQLSTSPYQQWINLEKNTSRIAVPHLTFMTISLKWIFKASLKSFSISLVHLFFFVPFIFYSVLQYHLSSSFS